MGKSIFPLLYFGYVVYNFPSYLLRIIYIWHKGKRNKLCWGWCFSLWKYIIFIGMKLNRKTIVVILIYVWRLVFSFFLVFWDFVWGRFIIYRTIISSLRVKVWTIKKILGNAAFSLYGNIVKDIRGLVSVFQFSDFIYLHRACNLVADALAKKAKTSLGPHVWLDVMPEDIALLFSFDIH